MRLFIGIEFPLSVLNALNACQNRLHQLTEHGRFKRSENFHLTLKFLGDIPVDLVGDMSAPLAEVAQSTAPFSLHLGRVGQFGSGNLIRTVWLDVDGETNRLNELQSQVEKALLASGFKPEVRLWRPHITLAQDVELAKTFSCWEDCWVEPTIFEVSEFALILSEEKERRRVYTPIQRFTLGKL